MLDGVQVAEHTCIVGLGIDAEGCKHPLGIWEGATENKAVCRRALADLQGRGLSADEGLLVVIDGSKALQAAVRDALGERAQIQRCRVHKQRNVLGHLPESERPCSAQALRGLGARRRRDRRAAPARARPGTR